MYLIIMTKMEKEHTWINVTCIYVS